jgi:hypothetical protein
VKEQDEDVFISKIIKEVEEFNADKTVKRIYLQM